MNSNNDWTDFDPMACDEPPLILRPSPVAICVAIVALGLLMVAIFGGLYILMMAVAP